MFPSADLADLLLHELARLGARRFPRPLVLAVLPDCSLLRHHHSPLRPRFLLRPDPARDRRARLGPHRLCCQRLCYQFDPSAPRPTILQARGLWRRCVAGDADEHPHRQSRVQHARLCDRGQALSGPDASQARAALGRAADSAAACVAAPRVDVPRFGRRVSRHAGAIRIPGRRRRPFAAVLALVALFNVEGTLDLVLAISLATVYGAAPHMGPAYWIPAFWVPALLVTHYVVFVVLGRRWTGPM